MATETDSTATLVIDNIAKTYHMGEQQVRALKGVSLQILQGEYVAIMGPSGCGKTTTLRMLAGLEAPSIGEIRLNGQVMNDVAHLKILTLPQNTAKHALTPRQREALQWVGDGKTTQDIALLMGLTAATVEKHLRLARESMGVETTAQAVLKAAFTNQMFVMDV